MISASAIERGSPVRPTRATRTASVAVSRHRVARPTGAPRPVTASASASITRARSGIRLIPWTTPRWTSWKDMVPVNWKVTAARRAATGASR